MGKGCLVFFSFLGAVSANSLEVGRQLAIDDSPQLVSSMVGLTYYLGNSLATWGVEVRDRDICGANAIIPDGKDLMIDTTADLILTEKDCTVGLHGGQQFDVNGTSQQVAIASTGLGGVVGGYNGNGNTHFGGSQSDSGASGDPHVYGAHGDRADFKGRNNTYYNVLSTSNLSVSVLFLHDTYNWRNKIVFGSWMKAVAITSMGLDGTIVKAAYNADKPVSVDVLLRNEAKHQIVTGQEMTFGAMKLALSESFIFSFSNVAWTVETRSSHLPYPGKNSEKTRLDLKIVAITNVDLDPVAPHGLIGQHYDRDNLKVIGELDDYMTESAVIETSKMGEGAIEGAAADYTVDRSDPFSTEFKFSRFGLTHAAPRDVSLLTGKKYEKSAGFTGGASNDELELS